MGDFGALKFCLQAGLQAFRQRFLQGRRNALRKKDAALVKATLFGSALGSSSQFEAVGVQHIGRNWFEEAGGIVLFRLGGGEVAWDAAIL